MNRIFYLVTLMCLLSYGCSKNSEENIPIPNKVEGLTALPDIGGVLLKWNLPDSVTYMYLQVSYDKNGKKVVQNIPNTVNSVLIQGLLNKYEYTFKVQPFNRGIHKVVEGPAVSTTTLVRPLKRPTNVVYFPNDLTKVTVNASMLDTYTQEVTEGPKQNLVDDDPTTYWHSSWSSNVKPLPHWIQLNFASPQKIGVIKYYLRQGGANSAGFPSQFGLEVSNDGNTWTRVWTSGSGLSILDPGNQKTLTLDQNYESPYFRIMILQTPGNTTYTNLGEIAFYTMKSVLTDLEKDAELKY